MKCRHFASLLLGVAVIQSAVYAGESSRLKDLLKQVQSDDATAKVQAIQKLAELGPKAAPAVPHLVDALKQDDEDLRLNATLALGKIGKAAVAPVAKLLSSDDKNHRLYAVWTLGWIGPPAKSAAQGVIKALSDSDDDVRRKAAYALGRITPDPKQVVGELMKVLGDKNNDVRGAASKALSSLGKDAVSPLIVALKSDDNVLRQQAIHTLGEIGFDAKAAVPALRELFLAKENGLPGPASATLGKIGRPAIEALKAGMNDERSVIRNYAMQGLVQVGADAAPIFLEALDDPNSDVRRNAAAQIYSMNLGGKKVVLALAYALKDDDLQVRQYCLNALQRLGTGAKIAAPKVMELLTDANQGIQQQAYNTLRQMAVDPSPGFLKALASDNEQTRIGTASLMVRIGADRKAALPVLRDGLKAKQLKTRVQAASALAMMQKENETAVPILIDGLDHKDRDIRLRAVQGLSYFRNQAKAAGPALVDQLAKESNSNMSWQIVNALRTIQPPAAEVLPKLAKLLKHEKQTVRYYAVNALPSMGAGAVPHLIAALKDKDNNVRNQAIYGLQRVRAPAQEILPIGRKLLADDNVAVRRAGVQLVGRYGRNSPSAAKALTQALNDKDSNVRYSAAQHLQNFGANGKSAVPALLKAAAEDKDNNVRLYSIYAVARLDAARLPELFKSLKSETDENIKQAAAQAASNIGRNGKAATPYLINWLKNGKSSSLRWVSAMALRNVGAISDEAVAALTNALGDTNPQVRIYALNALGNMGKKGAEAVWSNFKAVKKQNLENNAMQLFVRTKYYPKDGVSEFTSLLKSTMPNVRWQAARILGRIGPPAKSAVPALKTAADDTNQIVRQEARLAINLIMKKQK